MTEMAVILVMVMNIGQDNDDHGDGDEDHDNCDDNVVNADPLYLGLLGGVCQSVVWMSIAYTLLEI